MIVVQYTELIEVGNVKHKILTWRSKSNLFATMSESADLDLYQCCR